MSNVGLSRRDNELLRSSLTRWGGIYSAGGKSEYEVKRPVSVTWTGAYCDIFCNKFHAACNLKYILCWNWIGKKKEYKETEIKKKNKEKYLKWLRVCLFIVVLKFLFISSQWLGHTLYKQPDLFLWNQHETNILYIYTWWFSQ